MSLSVVNRHHYKGLYPASGVYIYVGRPGRIADEEIERGCLDGTAFGNPYRVGIVPEDRIIRQYKRWLWNRIQADVLKGPLLDIKDGSILVCSCRPRPCHGDVIADAWRAGQRGLL